jgi:hypothetical protein
VTTGIVPGRSIGPAVLGQTRSQMTADLRGRGFKVSNGQNAQEAHFENDSGLYVVGFFNGKANYIQKYLDTSIQVDSVSINSTVNEARDHLPDWKVLRCPGNTLLVSPNGLTYFLLPVAPNKRAPTEGSGVIVETEPITGC